MLVHQHFASFFIDIFFSLNVVAHVIDKLNKITQFFLLKAQERMSHCQSQKVCSDIVKMVTTRGRQIVRDNCTLKNHLPAFTDVEALTLTNELAVQFGSNFDMKQRKLKSQQKPKNLEKDVSCTTSLRVQKSPKKEVLSINGISFSKKIIRRNAKISRIERESTQMNTKTVLKQKQNSLIDLKILMGGFKDRRNSYYMKDDKQNFDQFRKQYCAGWDKTKQQKKLERQRREEESQRVSELKLKFQNCLDKKDQKIVYDFNGEILFLETNKLVNSVNKKFPSSNLRYSFRQQTEQSTQEDQKFSFRQKNLHGKPNTSGAVRNGDIPKLNTNLSFKKVSIDQSSNRKTNDLYSNNHNRQTTNIPFFSASDGTYYAQPDNRSSVSGKKKDRATLSQSRSKFKRHYFTEVSNDKVSKTIAELQQQSNEKPQKKLQISTMKIRSKLNAPSSINKFQRIAYINDLLMLELIK